MFAEIRRKDRILESDAALELLERGEYGFLAMNGVSGYGYGIPLSYVKEDDHLYFHCAPEGYKLECLRASAQVSFCVVGKTQVIPRQFTTAYESVLVFGHACLDLSEPERQHALELLVKKYAPAYEAIGTRYIEKSFHRTAIIRVNIVHLSGKCKRISGL